MGKKKTNEDRVELERRHSRDPDANPGNRSEDPEPHHALNNPASDPDPTEYPDPYERREDPRERGPNPKPPSTSEPHPPDYDDEHPPKK
jgi:hypothetical protein